MTKKMLQLLTFQNTFEIMKTATFEFGKQSLADWIVKNHDCERMVLTGKVPCDLWDDNYKEKISEWVSRVRREINIGWDSFDLLFGFDLIAKEFHPVVFDVADMHLIDWEGEVDDEMIPSDATEEQPSSILKMLVNKKYGTRFLYQNGILTSEDGQVLIHYQNVKGTITIPDTINTIGRLALAGIYKPEFAVVLPDGILRIEEKAFDMSDGLVAINFPDSLHSIGKYAFCGTELSEVSLPEGIEEIPSFCFQYAPVEKIHLPENLKYIRFGAFVGLYCDELRIPEGTEVVESWSIAGNYSKIHFPESIKNIAYDFYFEEMIDDPERTKPYVDIHPDNPVYFSKGGILYSRETGKEVLGKAGRPEKER